MEAGFALNELVAEKVLGWTIIDKEPIHETRDPKTGKVTEQIHRAGMTVDVAAGIKEVSRVAIPNYSGDLRSAMDVFEAALSKDPQAQLGHEGNFWEFYSKDGSPVGIGETPAAAICLGALTLFGVSAE